MNSIQHIDELVKEYLLFRGFTNTYKAFEADTKTDKDKGFQAEKIIEELFASVSAMDMNALLEQWRYLDIRYFSRLDHRFAGSVKKFELCLLRYYLVYGIVTMEEVFGSWYAIQHKRREKVVEFFEVHGAELQGNAEWVRWFALPFSKKPESEPEYALFFSKAWLDTFTVSLNNFLSTVFQNIPLPSLLCFNVDRLHRKALQSEIEALQSMIDNMRKDIQSSDAEISSLREQVALKKVTGARRRRAASMVEQQVVVNTETDVKKDTLPKRTGSQSSHMSQTNRLALTNARRLRAASDAASLAKSEIGSDSSVTSMSSEDLSRCEEPFIIVSQEIFLEHQSGITHARFSCEGSLISSCDAENIVRIWSYNGSSSLPPAKIANTCNILSLTWETRDRYEQIVKHLAYSPVEPILVCSVSTGDDSSGALVSVNMKTMTTDHMVHLRESSEVINAVGFNHNGQLVVTGDVGGMIRVYDIRSLTRIMEWSASNHSILACTFSFDETSIYSVDAQGQLSQDSIHKTDHRLHSYPLQGFTTSTLSSAMMMAASSSATSVRSLGGSSIRSKSFIRAATSSGGSVSSSQAHIPRIQLESSGGTVAAVSGAEDIKTLGHCGQEESMAASGTSSTTSAVLTSQRALKGAAQTKESVKEGEEASTLTLMNVGPGQLLAWSGDTDHLVMGCGNAGVLVQAEQVIGPNGAAWHKSAYCKPCHKKMWGPTGYGYGAGLLVREDPESQFKQSIGRPPNSGHNDLSSSLDQVTYNNTGGSSAGRQSDVGSPRLTQHSLSQAEVETEEQRRERLTPVNATLKKRNSLDMIREQAEASRRAYDEAHAQRVASKYGRVNANSTGDSVASAGSSSKADNQGYLGRSNSHNGGGNQSGYLSAGSDTSSAFGSTIATTSSPAPSLSSISSASGQPATKSLYLNQSFRPSSSASSNSNYVGHQTDAQAEYAKSRQALSFQTGAPVANPSEEPRATTSGPPSLPQRSQETPKSISNTGDSSEKPDDSYLDYVPIRVVARKEEPSQSSDPIPDASAVKEDEWDAEPSHTPTKSSEHSKPLPMYQSQYLRQQRQLEQEQQRQHVQTQAQAHQPRQDDVATRPVSSSSPATSVNRLINETDRMTLKEHEDRQQPQQQHAATTSTDEWDEEPTPTMPSKPQNMSYMPARHVSSAATRTWTPSATNAHEDSASNNHSRTSSSELSTNASFANPTTSPGSATTPKTSYYRSGGIMTPKKNMSFGGGGDICPRCQKVVYHAESALAPGGAKYHKLCLRCVECSKSLVSTNMTDRQGVPYCKTCYGKAFGAKGYGYGSGASMLHTEL
ncbi:WD repeat-containing protein 91 [Mortierella alpina]|nr:WD repeat-containing protein 91 [Mortierella alpina]